MRMVLRQHNIQLLAFYSLLVMLFGVECVFAGDPLSFSSSWNYRYDGEAGEGQYAETYSGSYSKRLSANMGLDSWLRYSASHAADGDKSSSLNPSLSFDLNNDLFSFSMNASESRTDSSSSATRISDTMGANISSSIDNWPGVRAYFSQTNSTDEENPTRTDTESTSFGGSVEYTWAFFDFVYDVRDSGTVDNLENSETETLDQIGQVSYTQSFLDGRISVSASQQYQVTDYSSRGDTAKLLVYGRYYLLDDDPAAAALGDETFIGKQVLFPLSEEPRNMTVEILGQECDRLTLTLYRFDLNGNKVALSDAQKAALTVAGSWTVYHKSILDTDWTPVPAAALVRSISDDLDRTLVVLDFPTLTNRQYVKVVADPATSATPAYVEDIEAYNTGITDENYSRQSKSLQTQFSTSARLTDSVSLNYSLQRSEYLLDDGDSLRFNHALSGTWILSESLNVFLGVSENTTETDGSSERTSRSYSASVSMLPLQDLTFSFGYTRSESDTSNGGGTVSDSLSSSVNAVIYPDLTANLTTSLSRSEDLSDGTQSDSYSLGLSALAYLTPRFDLNTNFSYGETSSSDGEGSTSTSLGLILSCRFSDALLVTSSYDGDFENDTHSFSVSSSWLWSRKLQSQIGGSFDLGDTSDQQYNALLSWQISRHFSFQSRGSFQQSEGENRWTVDSSINMIF